LPSCRDKPRAKPGQDSSSRARRAGTPIHLERCHGQVEARRVVPRSDIGPVAGCNGSCTGTASACRAPAVHGARAEVRARCAGHRAAPRTGAANRARWARPARTPRGGGKPRPAVIWG